MHTLRIDAILDQLFDAYYNSSGTAYHTRDHTLGFTPVMGHTETRCAILLLQTAGWYIYSTTYDRDMNCSTLRIMGI